MTVNLCHSGNVPARRAYDFWLATTDTKVSLPAEHFWEGVCDNLENAYNRCEEICVNTGHALARQNGSEIARTPTMGAYGTDFRLYVAWAKLAETLAADKRNFLIVCDDPWLFREIASRLGLRETRPPSLWKAKLQLRARGILSRFRNAVRLAIACMKLRHQRRAIPDSCPSILVYGHPDTQVDGEDAYFGDLMMKETSLVKVLHTDCELRLAIKLSGDRTTSLHAWGGPFKAIGLIATRWRPHISADLAFSHLIKRAVEVENSGAGPMMTRWQAMCQSRWIADRQPTIIIWPWENFSWERILCRTAKRMEIPTVGYQHTVVGAHQINFRADLNPDREASLPDRIVCNGEGYRRELADWGHDPKNLLTGGAFRVRKPQPIRHDEDAPIYFALSALVPIAREQIKAAHALADTGRRVLFRDHPMYPIDIAESANLRRAEKGLTAQKVLSAVVYSTGTSGLEALLAGLPTIRFQPYDRVAVVVLPEGLETPTATQFSIKEAIDAAAAPQTVTWDEIFTPVDYSVWADLLRAPFNVDANCIAKPI